MKAKRKRRSPKKGRGSKTLFLLILIGIALSMLFLFHREILNTFKPWFEKREDEREKKMVTLYFSDPEGEYLVGEKRKILKRREVKEEARETITELIKGPEGKLIPTLPSRTKLLSLQVDEKGLAKVNFNKALSKDHPGGSSAEIMTLYSIVNSLTFNFPQIKRVQILIEGEAGETIAGHLSLDQPVSSNFDLVRKTGKKPGKD
jgi:spore germination protein GerM